MSMHTILRLIIFAIFMYIYIKVQSVMFIFDFSYQVMLTFYLVKMLFSCCYFFGLLENVCIIVLYKTLKITYCLCNNYKCIVSHTICNTSLLIFPCLSFVYSQCWR